ncbi:hypothetical protein GQ457_16G029260 [Hibiscus cannabinus]
MRRWEGFGFVRFSNLENAQRAIVQMDLSVSLARYLERLEPRMKMQVNPSISKNVAPSEKPHHSPHEEFVLEKLKSCMVGTTINLFNAEKLIETLESKGLREFDVRQIAGNQFLIDFDREVMLSHCLKWEFQWLSDIFSRVQSRQ